jgi:hypothetical protein
MVQEIKTVPYVPLSHPFVERLIGTIRGEYLDQTLFWTAADLEEKLRAFQNYFNKHGVHSGLKGQLPDPEDAGAPVTLGFVPVAEALSRTLSDAYRRVISVIRQPQGQ